MSRSNTVRDRSGRGLPPKAERRAMGKAAARKRARQRRRRELLGKIGRVAGPVVVIAVIVGAVWLFSGGDDPVTEPTAAPTGPASPSAPGQPDFARADSLDPALETEPEVTAGEGTLTELGVTTIVAGTGPVVEAGNVVEAHYVGAYYATGEVFQSSWDMGGPIEFDLDGVIAGWSQGLVGVTVGSRVQLDIPAALAYEGLDGPQGDLRFVVDVLGVRP